jgi:hypothetical protein
VPSVRIGKYRVLREHKGFSEEVTFGDNKSILSRTEIKTNCGKHFTQKEWHAREREHNIAK